MTGRILIATLVLGLATSVAAADDDFWLGMKAGTLGLGVEASWRPIPYLDVRAGVNGFSLDQDRAEAGIDYLAIDLDSDMNGVPVALTGTLTGTTLTASSASGAYSLTGSFDKAAAPGTHTLTGTLQDTRKSRSVPVNLSGCRLN